MKIRTQMTGDIFGGEPIKEGDRGARVAALQTRLNTLSAHYTPIPPMAVDGIFAQKTKDALAIFQVMTGEDPTPACDEKTWHTLSDYYHNLLADSPLPITPKRPTHSYYLGSSDLGLRLIQYQIGCLTDFFPALPNLQVNGIFGGRLGEAVLLLKKAFGLPEEMAVTPDFCDLLQKAYTAALTGGSPEELLAEKATSAAEPVPQAPQAIQTRPQEAQTVQEKEEPVSWSGEEPHPTQKEAVTMAEIRRLEDAALPLSFGSKGERVREMQQDLNKLQPYYSLFPLLEADGNFGQLTADRVRLFQSMFALPYDGVYGKESDEKLQAVLTAAESGDPLPLTPSPLHTTLRRGSAGNQVRILQYMLQVVRLVYTSIPSLATDAIFGSATQNAVFAFQKAFSLTADGIVGSNTWEKLVEIYTEVHGGAKPNPDTYPGVPLRQGSSGPNVLKIQAAINKIRPYYPALQALAEDGKYGSATTEQVICFQRLFALAPDGVVGENTWNKLMSVKKAVATTPPPVTSVYGGSLLVTGSRGREVRILQMLLNFAKKSYPSLPTLNIDGIFGNATKNATLAFQALAGLSADGKVGPLTWAKLVAAQN